MSEGPSRCLMQELRSLSDRTQAEAMRRYFKTSRLRFLGVKSPAIRRLAKQHAGLVEQGGFEAFLAHLWSQGFYEARRAAVEALLLFIERGMPAEVALGIISGWLDEVDTWALVDPLGWSVGLLIRKDPEVPRVLRKWSSSQNVWRRRMTIVPYVDLCMKGHYRPEYGPLILEALQPHLGDPEFFVAKAVGWVLRELSKHDPSLVRAYMDEKEASISKLALREGSRKLSI